MRWPLCSLVVLHGLNDPNQGISVCHWTSPALLFHARLSIDHSHCLFWWLYGSPKAQDLNFCFCPNVPRITLAWRDTVWKTRLFSSSFLCKEMEQKNQICPINTTDGTALGSVYRRLEKRRRKDAATSLGTNWKGLESHTLLHFCSIIKSECLLNYHTENLSWQVIQRHYSLNVIK